MNSIKELKEQLGYEEIGLDDTFTFHCTQCGKCCIHREDILLSPKDLFNIAKKFQITPAEALEQYCETYIGCNSRFPIVRLRPQGSVKRCPLLKDQKCLVHDVKPTVCAMFPIGRYLTLSADDSFPKNPEELSVSGMGWDKVKQALEIEKKLGMEHLSGPEKGQKIRKLRNQFIQEFGKDSVIPASTLKGKDLKRVFWAVVNIDNLNKIEGMI